MQHKVKRVDNNATLRYMQRTASLHQIKIRYEMLF